MRHQIVKLVLLAAPESDRKDSPALPIGTPALASVGKIGPGPRRDEHRTLTDATVTKTPQNGQSAHVTTGVYVPVDVDQAPLSAAVAISIGAGGTAGQAMAHDGGSPSLLPADGLSTFVSTSACTTTVLVETASLPPGLTLPSPSGDGEARRRSSKIYRAEDMARHGSVYFRTRIEPPESRVAANSRFRELIDQVPGINHVRQGGVRFRTVSTFFNPNRVLRYRGLADIHAELQLGESSHAGTSVPSVSRDRSLNPLRLRQLREKHKISTGAQCFS